jgi:hypothetical protein
MIKLSKTVYFGIHHVSTGDIACFDDKSMKKYYEATDEINLNPGDIIHVDYNDEDVNVTKCDKKRMTDPEYIMDLCGMDLDDEHDLANLPALREYLKQTQVDSDSSRQEGFFIFDGNDFEVYDGLGDDFLGWDEKEYALDPDFKEYLGELIELFEDIEIDREDEK